MAEQAVSPMMKQYFEIKKQHPNEILFYRVGDFYEMFYDDALTASRELELTLTGKSCGKEERAPMCGVPFHSYETYVARLIAKGYKVAICEQMEDPALAKGLVKRDIIRVVTPGTVIESSIFAASTASGAVGVGARASALRISPPARHVPPSSMPRRSAAPSSRNSAAICPVKS